MPGTTGTPKADTVVLAAILSPMVWIALTRRPDEHDPRRLQSCGEFGVLREESVAGVDGLRPGATGRIDNRLDVQIALPRRCGTDAHRDVSLGDVTGTCVGVAEYGDRADAHVAQRADHAHGDFATVGDEHGMNHRHGHIRKTP